MIEVNEYVRTKDGHIAKYIEKLAKDEDIADGMLFDGYIYEKHKHIRYSFLKEIMVKHRKKLIDLIKVGDYVNGSKVLAVMEDIETGELHLEMTSNYTNEEIGDCTIYDKDIKTILTKESYMANCYKVGGEDE